MQEQQQVKSAGATDVQPTDIIFECPQCGKSLAIDPRGIGLVIACPDCRTEVQVPTADVAAQVTSSTLGELRERLELVEKMRALDKARFAKIADDMAMVQAALDRVVSLLQDALTPEVQPASHMTTVEEPDEE